MKHVSRKDTYNIQMALLRNYGYVARVVHAGDDDDPAIEVRGDTAEPLMTVTVSADGADWMITDHRREGTVALPRDTPLSQLAETIVAELERPH